MAVGDGTPGPGRPKGSQNKVTKAVKEAFEAAFNDLQTGENNLVAWAEANPTDFYKLASKLIPSELNANISGSLTGILGGMGRRKSDDPKVA